MQNKLLLLLFAGLFHWSAAAQNDWVHFQQPWIPDYIDYIEHDPQGNVWVSLWGKGLGKFDGTNWYIFNTDSTGIPSNATEDIEFAADGSVWIATTAGISHLQNGVFTNYPPGGGGLSQSRVWSLDLAPDGHVWSTVYANAVWEFDGDTTWTNHSLGYFANYYWPDLRNIDLNPDGSYWLLTPGAICLDIPCFTPSKPILVRPGIDTVLFTPQTSSIPNSISTFFARRADGTVVLAGSNGDSGLTELSEWDGSTWQSLPPPAPQYKYVHAVHVDAQNRIWLGFGNPNTLSQGGLAVYENGTWTYFTTQNGLLQDYVQAIDTDDAGNIWIAGKGVLSVLPLQAWKIGGSVYRDDDGNGQQAAQEPAWPEPFLEISPGPFYATGDAAGTFLANLLSGGDYAVRVILPPYRIPTQPVGGVENVSLAIPVLQSFGHVFGVHPLPDVNDLRITINNISTPRPGFPLDIVLTIKNTGTTAQAPLVSLDYPAQPEFLSADPAPTAGVNPLNWQLGLLEPLESVDIVVHFDLPASTPTGLALCFLASASGASDVQPADNSAQICPVVMASLDPNDKTVTPERPSIAAFAAHAPLTYTLRFQNTGNAPAEVVRLVDTLPAGLDVASLEILSASHPYQWSVKGSGILEFVFDNIDLPPASDNPAASNGFVQFRLRPKLTLAKGSVVSNQAHIYFDFNPPVATSTASAYMPKDTLIQTSVHELCPGDEYAGQTVTQDTIFHLTQETATAVLLHNAVVEILPVAVTEQDISLAAGSVWTGVQVFADTTLYEVLTAGNGCDSTVIWHVSVLTSGTGQPNPDDAFVLQPNPARTLLNLDAPAESTVEIFDNRGRLLQQLPMSGHAQLKISDWPEGLYWFRFMNGAQTRVLKLVKQE